MDSARPGGAPGAPRLLGRLTAELISRSPQYMSCISNYEIDLRGNKIGAIENLGATENQFDSIDLSDNAIVRLEGFPRLPRLKALYLNNNRVSKVARNLQDAIGNLELLVLTNNRISELKDIDPLSSLPRLTHLSLVGNPVALKHQYRLYAIARLPKLKVLDFKKVKQRERDAAAKLAEGDGLSSLAAAKTFEPGEGLEAANGGGSGGEEDGGEDAAPAAASAPTAEQLTAIKAAIANAQTLEEAERLEAALREGKLPSALAAAGGGGGGGGGDGADGEQQPMDEG
ncbi:U2 small nuclear ribonucleoprotein A [Raphidocelis subcapitata]|uniref:U2 small nuclear ribonucleoprotein A n=1 Tax=Raphidocelis subcapitata TaxID=307507 RepID=A0A2V0NYR2_9CHLO|nr:U2 small nuclear ribonucleoprotein A [Raphidocelis subcapitata]|eukprot:GBF90730.1 U2 small nuclear ribonucleoprotein A [Raphidocelis subcapitata]